MLDGTHYFDCQCGSSEHTLRFIVDIESTPHGDPELYTEVYLNQYRRWYKRLWVAIKYLFGYHCRYGHWDCWILNPDDAQRLKDMCDKVIEGQPNR